MQSIHLLDYVEIHEIQQSKINWHYQIRNENGATTILALDIHTIAFWHWNSQDEPNEGTMWLKYLNKQG